MITMLMIIIIMLLIGVIMFDSTIDPHDKYHNDDDNEIDWW